MPQSGCLNTESDDQLLRDLRLSAGPCTEEGLEGSLVQLEVTKPMCLWSWKRNAGMYAYICLPDYSKLHFARIGTF